MRKYALLYGLLVFIYSIANAQTQTFSIHGKVIDRNTRQGIPFANVHIEGDTNTGTATDTTGVFRITNAYTQKIKLHGLTIRQI